MLMKEVFEFFHVVDKCKYVTGELENIGQVVVILLFPITTILTGKVQKYESGFAESVNVVESEALRVTLAIFNTVKLYLPFFSNII